MKKILLSVLTITIIVSSYSQKATIELTFTAENNGQYIPLDSILIENLTQGGDTILFSSDTLIILDYSTGIGNKMAVEQNGFSVSQNYPNPFKDKTTVNLYLPEKEHIKIIVRDVIGSEVAQYDNILKRGNHSFAFYSGNEKHYLLTVIGEEKRKTIKLLNASSNAIYGGKCKISYEGYEKTLPGYKSQRLRRVAPALTEKAVNDFIFSPGDQLRFTGFAKTVDDINGSDEIVDTPLTDQLYVFMIIGGVRCPGTPTVDYEGQVYNTILIGSQCWLKENLNVGTMINGSGEMTDNSIIEKYCYDNISSNCSNYGGLYQWGEMMQYTAVQGAQGICPPGWHVPTDEDWKQLEGEVDSQYDYPDPEWDLVGFRGYDAGLKLKSISGWNSGGNGTDIYGFTARPNGWRLSNGDFWDLGFVGNLWTSTENYTNNAWRRGLSYSFDAMARGSDDAVTGFAIRCLKD